MNSRLEVIKQRMIDAGISVDEVDNLVKPLATELERRVCGLVWKHEGATTKLVEEMEGKLPVLTPVKDKNIVQDENGINHVLIEGENLLTLMAMQYTHIDENRKGLVDVCYIDPPYNTESTTLDYNDKFEKSEWLSMINIRLRLVKNILSDTGIIFISIDENYQAELKLLLNDIFGYDNKLGVISVVNNLKGRSDDKFFATAHEYLFCYAKNKNNAKIYGFPMTDKQAAEYKDHDAISNYKPVGLKKTGKNCYKEDRENMFYPIYYNELTNEFSLDKQDGWIEIIPYINGRQGRWRWGREKFLANCKTELLCKKQGDEYVIYVKMRDVMNDGEDRTTKAKSIWLDPKYDSGNGTKLIKDIFGDKVFENPKPIEYVKDVLRISASTDAIILDFYGGSGTTMQAVMELNAEDGANGKRQCIVCTNNELGKDAVKKAKADGVTFDMPEWEDYGVCHAITYPRLKTVITGERIDGSKYSDGMAGNNLYYYQVSDSITESPIPKITKDSLAKQAVSYIALKENIFNVDEYKDYHILHNVDTEIIVVIDPDRDYRDVQDNIASQAFSKVNRKVYCSLKRRTVVDGVEYIPYPEEVLDVLKSVKKRVRKESKR